MVEKQFSLRSVFVATTIVAVVLGIATRWQLVVQALPALPFALVGGCVGSVYARLIGPTRADATIGASLGAIAGGLIYFLLFPVAG